MIELDDTIISIGENIYSHQWKWQNFFENKHDIYLEIWTGLWNFFSLEAYENQDKNFIWMEIKYKRLFKTAEKTRNMWVKNFVLIKDFGQNIDKIFTYNEITQTYIFFPDPWDKKERQKKHKLLQKDFLEKLYDITKTWWKFCFKTDHKWYFEEVLEIIKQLNLWKIDFVSYDYEKESSSFNKQKMTEFESMFRENKLKIHYAEFWK